MPAVTFAVVAIVMVAAHQVADHVFGQTDKQSAHKAEASLRGWTALMGHVASYHLIMVAMLAVSALALHLPVSMTGLVVGVAVSALTHGFLDRRWPVRWILEHSGSGDFARRTSPICGMYLADQALHYGCLWVAALLVACL